MESALLDKLVELIADGEESELNLEEILVSEILDMDETISVEDARIKARSFIDKYIVDAEDIAKRLNNEAYAFYYDKLHDYYVAIGGIA